MQEPDLHEPDAHKPKDEPVQSRLLKAALDCFLADHYTRVTTRLIAERSCHLREIHPRGPTLRRE